MKKIIYISMMLLLSFLHIGYADSAQTKSTSKKNTPSKTETSKTAKKTSGNNGKTTTAQVPNILSSAKKGTPHQENKTSTTEKNTVTASNVKLAAPATSVAQPNTAKASIQAPAIPEAKSNLPVDCLYQTTASISENELAQWAQYAAAKSFDYSFDKLDTQLQTLKSCYTEKGWIGFNDALKQSGNLNVIKTQLLTVSSQISGKLEVNLIKPNQWRITVPLRVVYQNTKEKMTQSLAVVMVVTKKTSNELGIVQLIATPITEQNAAKS